MSESNNTVLYCCTVLYCTVIIMETLGGLRVGVESEMARCEIGKHRSHHRISDWINHYR